MKFCPNCGAELDLSTNADPGHLTVEYPGLSNLSIDGLYADMTFTFNHDAKLSIIVDGDQELVDAITFEIKGENLVMSGRLPGSQRRAFNNINMMVINNRIIINGIELDQRKMLKIAISLPWEAEVMLESGTFGSATVEDGGNLNFFNRGHMDVVMGSMNSLECYVSGNSKLRIGDVSEKCKLTANGNGSAKIRSVSGFLYINSSGNGNVTIGEVSGQFNAVKSGNGSIIIDRITGGLSVDQSGTGGFRIGSVDLQLGEFMVTGVGSVRLDAGKIHTLRAKTHGVGDFRFDGHALEASLRATGVGGIRLQSCDHILEREVRGIGRIKIG